MVRWGFGADACEAVFDARGAQGLAWGAGYFLRGIGEKPCRAWHQGRVGRPGLHLQ
jgi:hypothetical protein